MKKNGLIILVAFSYFLSCKSNVDNKTNQYRTEKESSSTRSFYKRFQGTIANEPVVMQMHSFKLLLFLNRKTA